MTNCTVVCKQNCKSSWKEGGGSDAAEQVRPLFRPELKVCKVFRGLGYFKFLCSVEEMDSRVCC